MNTNDRIGRREFLNRSVRAGISIALAGGASALLYDPAGPPKEKISRALFSLPDFSVPPVDGKTICAVTGPDREKSLETAIRKLGGIGRFVKSGDTVAIKPNAAFASPYELCATSHPDLISGLIRICLSAGARKVMVMDNPINDPASCFSLSGIEKAVKNAGGELMLPGPDLFRNVSLKNGRLILDWPVMAAPLLNADKLIGLAPVKSHHRSGASMSMKNWYGLLGGRRNIFHQDIHTLIAELAQLVKPTLVVLDGIQVMMTNGPTGGSMSDLKKMDTLVASCDQVACDSFGAGLLGLKISDLPYIQLAEKSGAGISDYASLKPVYIEAD